MDFLGNIHHNMTVVDNPTSYKFVRFQRSTNPDKKYDAILKNKKTGQTKKIPFGAKGYEHYKDKALGLYSSKDHLDPKRRASYRKRHQGEELKKYSSGYFAWKYLW